MESWELWIMAVVFGAGVGAVVLLWVWAYRTRRQPDATTARPPASAQLDSNPFKPFEPPAQTEAEVVVRGDEWVRGSLRWVVGVLLLIWVTLIPGCYQTITCIMEAPDRGLAPEMVCN